jgi:hypothetical protein
MFWKKKSEDIPEKCVYALTNTNLLDIEIYVNGSLFEKKKSLFGVVDCFPGDKIQIVKRGIFGKKVILERIANKNDKNKTETMHLEVK